MKRKNKTNRSKASKLFCIILKAISHCPVTEAFQAAAPFIRGGRSVSILSQENNHVSSSYSRRISWPLHVSSQRPPSSPVEQGEDGQELDDESFLLSQALNPNKNSSRGENENNDPVLSILGSTTTNKNTNIQQQWGQSQRSTPWYENVPSNQSLPFDCTGCGKCCQTKGEVYLNPSETKEAAAVLNMSIDEFKDKYTSRDVTGKKIKDSWTVLKQKKDSKGIEGCIFLDEETKMCSIYEARPLQCSTYPFWPRIMESIDTWNDEVVFNDGQSTSERNWTPEGGGCEGMKEIKVHVGSDNQKLIVLQDRDNQDGNGVSINDALDRLESYSRYKRAFPI